MNVIAKFVCTSVTPTTGEQKVVKAVPVIDGSEENKSFSRWTTSGSLEMFISDETQAGDFFTPGEEFYMTFSKEKP